MRLVCTNEKVFQQQYCRFTWETNAIQGTTILAIEPGHLTLITNVVRLTKMQEPNPYTPTTTDSATAAGTPIDNRNRVLTALAIGFGCCLIGPVFLSPYYAFHGIGLGVSGSISFFGLDYVAPGLLAVAMGLLIGHFMSRACPRLRNTTRRIVVISEVAVVFSIGIYLLLNNFLNFGVEVLAFELPAFSVSCGFGVLITTSIYLAVS